MAAETRIRNEAVKLAGEAERLQMLLQASAVSMKLQAEEIEKENKTHLVEKLGGMTEELVEAQRDLSHYAQALQAVTEGYRYPGGNDGQDDDASGQGELTDWQAAIAGKIAEIREAEDAQQPFDLERHDWVTNFKRAVWNVNHAGEPMPGEEEEELMMMTQALVKNHKCPFTLVDVAQLQDPVCCSTCRHIYSNSAIRASFQQGRGQRRISSIKCPVSGCQSTVTVDLLVCDTELQMALVELRTRQASGAGTLSTGPASIQDVQDIS